MTAPARKLRLVERPRRKQDTPAAEPWPVLVVDDDPQVHDMTRVLLRDFQFDGRGFTVLSAHSAAEGEAVLRANPDIPVALVDVVMEAADAGLRLVRRIRDDLGNRRLRIILRTGQPGEAPERDVVLSYDINDYKSKTELTAQKLFTALVGAVRAWRHIVTVETVAESLERKVAERTADLEASRDALMRAKDRAELALKRESEAKSQLRQFVSMVSHEFRTPLAIIDSAAQMLTLKAEKCDPGMLPRLDGIRGAVTRLVELIDTCLADEQLDSGRLVLREQAVDLVPLVESIRDHHAASGRPIRVSAVPVPAVWGDPGLLALALNNLVGNAVKYSPDGAPVEITVTGWHDGVAVRVVDHGIGIPADDLPLIFERFHRAANVRTVAGSGIGLHMVRQIVELHGGSVSVDSSEGAGSAFTVRLRPAPPPRRRRR